MGMGFWVLAAWARPAQLEGDRTHHRGSSRALGYSHQPQVSCYLAKLRYCMHFPHVTAQNLNLHSCPELEMRYPDFFCGLPTLPMCAKATNRTKHRWANELFGRIFALMLAGRGLHMWCANKSLEAVSLSLWTMINCRAIVEKCLHT